MEPRAESIHPGWLVFSLCGGRVISYLVCASVDAVARSSMGTPDVRTKSGITQLWSRRYGDIPHVAGHFWTLSDGTRLTPDTQVFESHLSTPAMRRARKRLSVDEIDYFETLELAALLRHRRETALVGRGILRARLSRMEWSLRETPASLHRDLDTFLRRLYLLAAAGAKRASRNEGPVAECAISVRHFIERSERLL